MPYILIILFGLGAVSFGLIKTWREVGSTIPSSSTDSISANISLPITGAAAKSLSVAKATSPATRDQVRIPVSAPDAPVAEPLGEPTSVVNNPAVGIGRDGSSKSLIARSFPNSPHSVNSPSQQASMDAKASITAPPLAAGTTVTAAQDNQGSAPYASAGGYQPTPPTQGAGQGVNQDQGGSTQTSGSEQHSPNANRWNTDSNLIYGELYKAQYGYEAFNKAMIDQNYQIMTNQ